jgi:hypothetical protein
MGFIAYDNRLFGTGAWTDNSSPDTFASTPPIENLGTPQTPGPFAEFDGDTADFSFEAQDATETAEDFTVRVLALIGMDLPDGITITWYDESDTQLATQTWNRYKNRPRNSYIVLDSDQTTNTVRCAISGAGSGTHRIAAAWAGPAWIIGQGAGYQMRNQSDARIERVSGTDWAWAGVRRRGVPFTIFGNRGEIRGVNYDGTEYTSDDAETILHTIGLYGPVIACESSKSQNTIDALTIYGRLDSAGDPEHLDGDVWSVGFRVLESR